MKRCRFPFAGNLNSTSGPDVLVAAFTEALREDSRFADLNEHPWGEDDIPWFPVGHHLISQFMAEGKPFAIGPNVLFGHSQHPGAYGIEPQLLAYQNFAAVFTLSRWYSALQQKHFAQKSRHYLTDFPIPESWLKLPWDDLYRSMAMIFVKGGKEELEIASKLRQLLLPTDAVQVIQYGSYKRADLLEYARASRACYYISQEDQYPIAAVEIGMMGCPIVSDERSCPTVAHGLTGIICPVRERGESEAFKWTNDAAERLASVYPAAVKMNSRDVRAATIIRHMASDFSDRAAAAMRLG